MFTFQINELLLYISSNNLLILIKAYAFFKFELEIVKM